MSGNLNSGRRKGQPRGRLAADRIPSFDGSPVKPQGLSGEALLFWNGVVPKLVSAGVAKAIDGPALEMLACAWANWKRLQDGLAAETVGERAQADAARAAKLFLELAARFGLTPGDRGRVRTFDPPEDVNAPPEEGSLEELFERQREICGMPRRYPKGDGVANGHGDDYDAA